ncbi:MAG TPA: DUF1684 domain-containing protein [Dehalococcoidia bacterium]|nr:DUF1684 domain-containing protein [Dehalococcoidia bacterium]
MTALTEFRASKDQFFGSDHQSPLTPPQQEIFSGLNYYDESPTLAYEIEPQPFDVQETIEMQTSTGDVASYVRWARIHFDVDDSPAELTVFRDAQSGSLFLPFQDANAGSETYGAGRYLEVEALHDGKLHVDFNYAYNPYCAYNEMWSCPIPPGENRLTVAIAAGERTFDIHNP